MYPPNEEEEQQRPTRRSNARLQGLRQDDQQPHRLTMPAEPLPWDPHHQLEGEISCHTARDDVDTVARRRGHVYDLEMRELEQRNKG